MSLTLRTYRARRKKQLKDRFSICRHCSMSPTSEDHDSCLGTLKGPVMNACCGHGNIENAYVQLRHNEYKRNSNKILFTGMGAMRYILRNKK